MRFISRRSRHPACLPSSTNSFQVGSSSILTHSLNRAAAVARRGRRTSCCTTSSCGRSHRPAESPYCLLQVNDVTVAVTRERVLRERQNARYHAIVDFGAGRYHHHGHGSQRFNGSTARPNGFRLSRPTNCWANRSIFCWSMTSSLAAAVCRRQRGAKSAATSQVIGRRKRGAARAISMCRWRAGRPTSAVFVTTIWRDVTERMAADAGAARERRPSPRSVGGVAAIGVDQRPRRRLRLFQSAMAGLHRRAGASISVGIGST